MKNSDETGSHDVILFTASDQLVAIDIDCLVEILESVPVSPLPFVPAYVDGLVNVNGKIMPQVDLARLLFGEVEAKADITATKTLLIVDIHDVPIALKIDQVKESYTVAGTAISSAKEVPAKPEDTLSPAKGKNRKAAKPVDTPGVPEKSGAAFIIGHFDYMDSKAIFFDALALKDVVKSTAKPSGKQGFLGKVVQTKNQAEQFNEYLITEVIGKELAVGLEEVNEIVIMESIKSQPRAPSLVVGVGLVRGEPRLMISLAELLGEKREEKVTAGAAIMVKINDILCGVLADKMVGLETIRQNQLKQNKEKNHLTILREDGSTLTKVIQFSTLFDHNVLAQIRPYLPNLKNAAEKVVIKQVEMLRFVLGTDAYAFKLDDIRRIVSGKVIEPLLSKNGYMMGTMELEGKVVPVINLIQQLGYEQSNIAVTEYIVVSEGDRDWGLAIGETDQIIKIDEPKIDMVKSQDARYVAAYASHEDDLLTILNIKAICHDNHHAGAA